MVKFKFCMISLASIIPSLDPGDWYAALDLQDAYFHIHIFEGHRRFLRFTVGQEHYQFMVLPFGLSTAPRVFTKCMSVVAAYLRLWRVQIFPYPDNWLVKGSSWSQVWCHVALLLSMCTTLGLLVNNTNSMLVLVQRIEVIGAVLDASSARASLPPNRFETLKGLIDTVTRFPVTTARACLQFLGHVSACMYVVCHTRLRMRPLQLWLASEFSQARDRMDKVLTVPKPVITSLGWWSSLRNMLQGVPFRGRALSLDLVSNALDLGWGAHVGNVQTQGLWLAQDLTLYINIKELRAVRLACMAFHSHLEGQVVRVLTDNTASMFCINRQGGAQSSALCHEALRLWDFCIAHNICLRAFHLPGAWNSQADHLSRDFSSQHEWSLHPEVVHRHFQVWGTPGGPVCDSAEPSLSPVLLQRGWDGRYL
ncbi:uncharacterized protein LOC128846308 [Malaclemys terrapin pileata]|uniref:uncharacterized protein LOC128846308 n=1 Tax=Malaclemys terrapin pileata TaxID=2991368 RepID=UPI0023A86370|nr:uncharacterized protein LOC128846308 [Malaclemys terrapin pileata]